MPINVELYFLFFQKAEPTQFIQLHGCECKIHVEASAAGDAMMPWQG